MAMTRVSVPVTLVFGCFASARDKKQKQKSKEEASPDLFRAETHALQVSSILKIGMILPEYLLVRPQLSRSR
jgi:hypothetical protein